MFSWKDVPMPKMGDFVGYRMSEVVWPALVLRNGKDGLMLTVFCRNSQVYREGVKQQDAPGVAQSGTWEPLFKD
jgi:hypothetical protein